MPGACGIVGNLAGVIVDDGWYKWQNFARSAIDDTQKYLEDLDEVDIGQVAVNVSFDVPSSLSAPFQKPEDLNVPDLDYNEPDPVTDITTDPVKTPKLTSFTGTEPDEPPINIPGTPDPLTEKAPTSSFVPGTYKNPDEITIKDPDDPRLLTITVPSTPEVTIPTFTKEAPIFTGSAPPNTFAFAEELYQSNTLDNVTTRVNTMLNGGTGIPDAIWQAIWEKNTEREDINGEKAVMEATEEWAAKGFSLPPGALTTRVNQIRQQVLEAKNTASREVAIQQAQMEQQNIQFAVAQALALEDTLISAHLQRQARALQAQQVAVELSINIFNAQVTAFNARVQAFNADAEAYRTVIDGVTKELEAHRLTLDGKRIEGELNRQEIELFSAQLQAQNTRVQNYRAQVDAVSAFIEQDKNRIDLYRTQVEAFKAKVDAKTAEFNAYGEQIKGELAKVQVFDSQVNAYTARINAWRSLNDGLIAAARIDFDVEELKIKKFAAQLERFTSEVQAEVGRINAQSQIYSAQARVYAAELSAESARVETEDKQFALAIEKAKAETSLELQQAQVNIAQLQRIAELEMDQLKTIATVNSSLAAGAMAAVNLSAGIQEQASNSVSCQTSYSF